MSSPFEDVIVQVAESLHEYKHGVPINLSDDTLTQEEAEVRDLQVTASWHAAYNALYFLIPAWRRIVAEEIEEEYDSREAEFEKRGFSLEDEGFLAGLDVAKRIVNGIYFGREEETNE